MVGLFFYRYSVRWQQKKEGIVVLIFALLSLLSVSSASYTQTNTPEYAIGTMCFERSDALTMYNADVKYGVDSDESLKVTMGLILAQKCVGTVFSVMEHVHAQTTEGVGFVVGWPYKGYSLDDVAKLFRGGARPPKQPMFFIAGATLETRQ